MTNDEKWVSLSDKEYEIWFDKAYYLIHNNYVIGEINDIAKLLFLKFNEIQEHNGISLEY
jgi:hypothetical protein